MSKTFSVNRFNREVNKTIKNATKNEKANFRMAMLYKALCYSVKVKGGVQ